MDKVVWLLNHYSQEPTGSGGTRHFCLARHAAKYGIKVILIAASVEHFTGRQRLMADEDWRLEDHQGVQFLWIRTSTYSGNGKGRMRNMLEYSLRVLRKDNTRQLPKPDLVVGSSVHPFAALSAQRLARRFDVPFVFEVRDLWPETLIQMGALARNCPTARVLRQLERWLYHRASRIITLLPRADDYIAALGVDRQKITWISNGVDINEWPYYEPSCVESDVLTVMYLGSHGQANGLNRVLEAIARWRDMPSSKTLRFRLVGDGPLKADLQEYADQLKIDEFVSFEPPVAKMEVPALFTQADIFVVNVRELPLYRYGISLNKLFDYLAAGRPVVFAGSTANDPVAEAGAGISVPGDDVEGMAEAFWLMAAMTTEERRAMGRRGRAYVEKNYSYEQLAKRLCDELLPLMS